MKIEILGITEEQEKSFFEFAKAFGLSIVGDDPAPEPPAPYVPLGKLRLDTFPHFAQIVIKDRVSLQSIHEDVAAVTQSGTKQNIDNLRRLHHEHEIGMRAVELLERDKKLPSHGSRTNFINFVNNRDAILADLYAGPKE